MRFRGLQLGAVLLVLVGSLPTAWASSDEGTCPWGVAYCPLQGLPFLDVDNDTNDNLLRLVSAEKHFALPVYAFPLDASRVRNVHFGYHYDASVGVPPAAPEDTALSALKNQLAALGIPGQTLNVPEADELDTRFVSNSIASTVSFIAALQSENALTAEQRKALAQIRLALLAEGNAVDSNDHVGSATWAPDSAAGAFYRYLSAARAFYYGNYSVALNTFSQLAKNPQQWVAQAASYMLIRTALNMSTQSAQDEYDMFDARSVNKQQVRQALEYVQAYLAAWPNGVYRDSAVGLQRRMAWYLQDWPVLGPKYETALMHAPDATSLKNLVAETDSKFLSRDSYGLGFDNDFVSDAKMPLLSFTQSLRFLREYYRTSSSGPKITADSLKELQLLFNQAGRQPLGDYLHIAWLYWQQQDYQAVLAAVTPQAEVSDDDLPGFSQQVLYGYAQMALKQWPQALAHWKSLLAHTQNGERRAFLQAQVAAVEVEQQNVGRLFAAGSPVTNLRYRSLVLKTLASPDLLRQQVSKGMNDDERTIALHTLLMRDLMAHDYSAWLADIALKNNIAHPAGGDDFSDVSLAQFGWDGKTAETGYYCHPLHDTVQSLAQSPSGSHSLNCLGEFIRTTNAQINTWPESGGNAGLDTAIERQKPVTQPDRMALYRQVINNPNSEPEDKSFALYRAVMCYAPSGYNDCGGQDVSKAQRRQWFNQLHRDYPGNIWAKQLRYYW